MATIVRVDIDRTAALGVAMLHADRLVRGTTRRTSGRSRLRAPVRTGALHASRSSKVTRLPTSVRGEVVYGADYAAMVHEGTRPHVIRPRRAKALRFRVGGRIVFAQRVNHPGTKDAPYLYNALRESAVPRGFRVVRGRSAVPG